MKENKIMFSIPKDARDTWINPDTSADILATFIDNKGRKQYRYNSKVLKRGAKEKFKRAERLGRNITRIRNRIEDDLARRRMSRPKVVALIVKLIDLGCFRVGTEKYSIENGTFGISTINKGHISFADGAARFEFVGKKGVEWDVQITDPVCINNLQILYNLSGNGDNRLFIFEERGQIKVINRDMINRYLDKYAVTAKDFRTYHATRICAEELHNMGAAKTKKDIRKNISTAVDITAKTLGHTPSVCRSSHINPRVIKSYQNGDLDKLRRHF